MKKISRICMLVLILIIFSSNFAPAYVEDEIVISRISNLLNIYCRKMILRQIIGKDNDNFTININNSLSESPHTLKGINEAYIDAHSIYCDMARYNITIDELETRLIINATPAYNKNKKVISRIANLINTYGKKTILHQIIGKDKDNFTINSNNILYDSHPPLQLLDENYYEDYIDAHSIYYDMARYKLTIDELEKRLKIEADRIEEERAALERKRLEDEVKEQKIAAEKAALEEKRIQDEMKAQKMAEEKVALERKRLQEEKVASNLKIKSSLLIGVWKDNYSNGKITIYKDEQGLFYEEVFYNENNSENSTLTKRLVERNILGKKRLINSESPSSDYFIIEENGNLGLYDSDGLIDTALMIDTALEKKTLERDIEPKTYSPSSSCYDLGYRYGRCGTMSLKGRACDPDDDIVIPVDCRNREETRRGIADGAKSVW